MARYLAARITQAVVSLLLIAVVMFAIVRLTGDPVQTLLPIDASREMEASVRHSLGLDDPLPEQFFRYMGDMLTGDFGISIVLRRPVTELLGDRIINTLILALPAIALTFLVGIPLGVYAADRANKPIDWFARGFAILGQSVPVFWLGIILIWQLSNIFPTSGMGSLRHLVLPVLTLTSALIAGVTRLTRSSMLEQLSSTYIEMARLKGVRRVKILWVHALRNAGISIVTFSGILALTVLTGSVVVETVFAWPGIGRLLIDAATGRDFPVVQATVLLLAALYIGGNLVIDILYVYLNPKVRV